MAVASMSIFDLIPKRWRFRMASGLLKAAAFPIVPEWVTGSFLEPTWTNLVKDGWKKNAAVYACVSALAMAFPEPPLVAQDMEDNAVSKRHPLQRLMDRPNGMMSRAEFMTYCITWLAIGGNLYIHKVRNRAGKVVELWPYHAGHITPIPGATAWVEKYEYDPGNGRTKEIPAEDIIHIKWPLPDPEQPWMSTPPLLHAARETDTDSEATRYLFALLKNDALPRTVIEMPGDVTLSTEQFKRLKKQFNERYGADKRGSVGLLEGGAKMSRISLDLQELAFEGLRRVPEARIAAAFRVPPIVAGLNVGLERSTYSNYREAVSQFTEGTLVPLWNLVADELTQGLFDDYQGELTIVFDLGNVRALQENETEKYERLDLAVRGGWMTVNEARQKIGLDEVVDGDVFLRGLNVVSEPGNGQKIWEMPAVYKANGEDGKPPDLGIKSIRLKQTRMEAEKRVGETLVAMRQAGAINMEKALDDYFSSLSERVVSRAVNYGKAADVKPNGKKIAVSVKELPPITDLLEDRDIEEMEVIVRRFYADLINVTYGVLDIALGTDVAFDLNDPIVSEILNAAAKRVRAINDTTRQEIIDLLKYGNEHGWSIDQLVRGDPDEGITGLRDLVEETYKGRAKTIARTELGTAQNEAATGRYESAGVEEVLVLDNGFDNSDENCTWINGKVRPLAWTKSNHPDEGPSGIKNPLQHPNCVRAFAPHFGE